MANYLVFVIAFSVMICNDIDFVGCVDQCETHADCEGNFWTKHCCGGYFSFGSKDRTCTSISCLYHYCSSYSDCGDQSMCCRSNECVKQGCSGCTDNSGCDIGHICCKKTFPFDQTVCAANCINQTCNSNNDCAGLSECCRSGKCVKTGCYDECTSNSECNLDQYCCKKKTSFWGDSCAQSCVGEICRIDDDCGAPNECCISNKCVDFGCSGCTTNANCSTGHYCCKKRQWYVGEFSECSAHCVGKSCSRSDDCGGPGETCDSDHRCAVNQESNTASKSLPPWLIAVITVSLVVFLIAVGLLLSVFWHVKKKPQVNTIHAGTMPLQNIHQGAEIQNQPNTQFSHLNNPTAFETQLQQCNNSVARQSHNPQRFHNAARGTPNQDPLFQNPTKNPQNVQGNENHGFHMNPSPNYDDQGHHTAMSSFPAQSNNEVTLEATKDTQYQDRSGQKMKNAPHQGNDYVHNPLYNPQYQGNLYQETHL